MIKNYNPFFTIILRLALVISGIFLSGLQGYSQMNLNYSQLGLNALRNGNYIEALENLNLAIAKEPYVPETWFLRGYAKYSLDDYIGAERDYSKSIELVTPFG